MLQNGSKRGVIKYFNEITYHRKGVTMLERTRVVTLKIKGQDVSYIERYHVPLT